MHLFLLSLAAVLPSYAASSTFCDAKSPFPTGAMCGQRGTTDINQAFSGQASSAAQCLDYCFYNGEMDCLGISYDRTTQTCGIYFVDLSTVFTPDPTGDTVVYELSCFDCSPNCPVPKARNLVLNPGFDDVADQDPNKLLPYRVEEDIYGGYTEQVKIDIVAGHNSKNALACRPDTNAQLPSCAFTQDINLSQCPRFGWYAFSLDLKHTVPASLPQPSFFWGLDEFSSAVMRFNPGSAGKWVRSTFYYQHTNQNALAPEFVGNPSTSVPANESVYVAFDNLDLRFVGNRPFAKRGAKNLYVDGGFETGKLPAKDYTAQAATVTVQKPGINSTFGLHWKIKPSSEFPQLTTSHNFKGATPGKYYIFSYQVRGVMNDGLQNVFSGGAGVASTGVETFLRWNDTTTISYIFHATASSGNAGVFISFPAHLTYIFDNFSIKELGGFQ